MLNKVLTTPVDDLVELIKKNQNCTINYLKTSLKVPYDIVEKWLIILEEYKVIEIHYQGFEGFIKYIKKDLETKDESSNKIDIYSLKDNFVKKSKMRNLDDVSMKSLWPKFVLTYEPEIKIIFFEEAKKRNFTNTLTEKAWEKYKEELKTL